MKSSPDIKPFEIPSSGSDSASLRTYGKMTLILAFLLVLAIETMGFFMIRSTIAQAMGQALIVIDLGSVIVLFLGAGTLTYFYYTRYVRREILFEAKSFTLKIGKREFSYEWDEFSLVTLSTASATYGPKGFSIRLYTDDLEGEYVELPMYRFTKGVDVFDLRTMIEDKVKIAAKEVKVKSN
ncbi:MAG: hypothetical protein ACW97Z_08405 [Candidatus Hodarchaeales archaeon]|jgi:hypothetical protein